MPRFLLLGLVFAACSSGPAIPDGGTACSINADCPMNTSCRCPVVYQNCVDGVCSTTCPVENGTAAGQACGSDCECQSGFCGFDHGLCCATLAAGAGGGGASCQKDCDCISAICSSNVCQ